jgi:hypothetical protein
VSFLEGTGLVLGIGIAIGMLAGTTGTRGSARGGMTLLAAAIGLVAGLLLAGAAELGTLLSALFGFAGAAVGCIVISDVVSGASRREGGAGALGFLVSLMALLLVAAALLLPVLTLAALLALAWLGFARQRRARRKHAGLRVLR